MSDYSELELGTLQQEVYSLQAEVYELQTENKSISEKLMFFMDIQANLHCWDCKEEIFDTSQIEGNEYNIHKGCGGELL